MRPLGLAAPIRPLAIPLCFGLCLLAGCAAVAPTATSPPPPKAPPVPPVSAPASAPPHDQLDALTWYQTSEEVRRLSESVFVAATAALDAALADPGWSALGQGAEAASLPAAVITDVDETIFDNSALQARLALDGLRYSQEIFEAWSEAAAAEAVPGALAFAREAARRGVTIFYVSNRNLVEEPGTRRNLERLGFPLDATHDVVLSRGERPEWGSDKESRRREVARSYRVLLLLGDDLNDFLPDVREASAEARRASAESAKERWGRSWFLLPNPLYGSWERSAVGAAPATLSSEEVRARKRAALRRYEGPLPAPRPR